MLPKQNRSLADKRLFARCNLARLHCSVTYKASWTIYRYLDQLFIKSIKWIDRVSKQEGSWASAAVCSCKRWPDSHSLMSIMPMLTNATRLTHSTWASAEMKHGWAWIPRLARFVLRSLARHSCSSCMDTLHDTTRVCSRDPEPYDATTLQDNLLPIYQQEARCIWTSIARNRELVAQHGWIKTIPINETANDLSKNLQWMYPC